MVSAPGKSVKYSKKVTDLLIEAYSAKGEFDKIMNEVQVRFDEFATGLGVHSIDISREIKKIKRYFRLFHNKSYLLSRGEYLTAKIFAVYLNATFIDSAKLIKFNRVGKILGCTYKKIQTKIKNKQLVVIPGFYGSNIFGKIKVMSRGGSDITGTIVSKAVNVKIYENWTDVSFIESDYFDKGKSTPILHISYRDMRFLSFFGASVLHYKSSSMLFDGLTMIRNTQKPRIIGTLIKNNCRRLKFAHTMRKATEIEINDTKRIQKLLKRLHADVLYKQSVMGNLVVAFCTSLGYLSQKDYDELISQAHKVRYVYVHAYIVSNKKRKNNILLMNNQDKILHIDDCKFLIVKD